MKRLPFLMAGLAGLLLLTFTTAAFAGGDAGKEMTITGKAMCVMCALHRSDTCQTIIRSDNDGKTDTYYLTDNDLSKSFHKKVCEEAKPVTATGTVVEKDGKSELTVTKIDLVK